MVMNWLRLPSQVIGLPSYKEQGGASPPFIMTYKRIGLTPEVKQISTLFIGASVIIGDNEEGIVRNVSPLQTITIKMSSGRTRHIPLQRILALNPVYTREPAAETWI